SSSSSSRENPRRQNPPSFHCAGGSSTSVREISAATSAQSSPSSSSSGRPSLVCFSSASSLSFISGKRERLRASAAKSRGVATPNVARAVSRSRSYTSASSLPSAARNDARSNSHSTASSRLWIGATSRSGAESQRRKSRPPIAVRV